MDDEENPREAEADELARKIDAICCEYSSEAVYLALAMILGRDEAASDTPDLDVLDATVAYIRNKAEVYFDCAMAEGVMAQFDVDAS